MRPIEEEKLASSGVPHAPGKVCTTHHTDNASMYANHSVIGARFRCLAAPGSASVKPLGPLT